MTPSTPGSRLIAAELRTAPYWASVAGATVVALTFFTPFYPVFIVVALGLGALSVAILWIGARYGAWLNVIGVMVTILVWSVARKTLLPHEMSAVHKALNATQFVAT